MSSIIATNLNSIWCSLIVNIFKSRDIVDYVVSPGYRCAPISYVLNNEDGLNVTSVVDERSAAFFALGKAQSLKRPVVLVCTSGTALANYLPAVIEAKESNIPLIIWSADRPFELLNSGANQTIDQTSIFDGYCVQKLILQAASTEIKPAHLAKNIKFLVDQAVEKNLPIHLNQSFRAPLEPVEDDTDEMYADLALLEVESLSFYQMEVKELFNNFERPLIILGKNHGLELDDVKSLLENHQVYLGADICSGLKSQLLGHPQVIDNFDHKLILDQFNEAFSPDLIILIGTRPVSNDLFRYIEREEIACVTYHQEDALHDSTGMVVRHFQGNGQDFLSDIEEVESWAYELSFTLNQTWSKFIADEKENELTHFSVLQTLLKNVDEQENIFLGNSTPIRAFDQYMHGEKKELNFYFNRGVSGIEGLIASASGIADAKDEQVILCLGDVSFMHDFGSVYSILKNEINGQVKVLLFNNQCGGIFSRLPLSKFNDEMGNLVNTEHNEIFDLEIPGINIDQVNAYDELEEKLKSFLNNSAHSILEININHEADIKFHEKVQKFTDHL